MKKITCACLSVFLITPCFANIHIKPDVVQKVIDKHFPNKTIACLSEYNKQLKTTNGSGIVASKLWRVCTAGGLNIRNPIDKGKCKNFAKDLIHYATIDVYAVCGQHKGKSGGNEFCVDNVFTDIEVQIAQAKNLAQEYAKVKYGDSIVCSTKIRSSNIPVIPDDYIKCVSIKNGINFYEFKFDDAKESNMSDGKFVQREFGRGLCLIYGGKPEHVIGKLLAINDSSFECSHSDCNKLSADVQKWGYVAKSKGNGTCLVSYNQFILTTTQQNYLNYYAKFDGKTLSVYTKDNNKIIKSWKAVSGHGKTSNDSTPTICQLPQYQPCKAVGPIPSGTYSINSNEIQYADNIKIGNFNSNKPWADRGGVAWGDARVPLHPDPDTNTYGRDNMYIHGGKYAGSAGCIDLTTHIKDFVDWFAKQKGAYLKVIVDYGSNIKLCTQEKQCDTNGNCSCICPTDEQIADGWCQYIK